MDVQKFEMIMELYKGKTLAEVADEYSYTPSAVSHILKSMEAELGIQMFIRSRSSIIPTPEGREIYPFIDAIVNDYQYIIDKASKLASKDAGVIRLSSFTSVVVSWLPSIINSFKEKHPGIQFEILQGNYHETADYISRGIVDCGFTIDIANEEIESYRLTSDRLYVIFPHGHPIGTKNDFHPRDIEKYPSIVLNEGSEKFIFEYLKSHNIELNVICRVVDDYAVSAMVESGLGISVVPELFLYRSPYAIGSRCLDENFYRPICISYRKTGDASPLTTSFINHVKEWASNNKNVIENERRERLIIQGDNTVKK